MTQQSKSDTGQKQNIKKYLVFAIMFIVFAVCMWWIFAPSGSDKEAQEQAAGFNTDLPDPKGAGIVDNKQTAYEQEQMRLKQEEKMRSLQDYSYMLDGKDENHELDETQGQYSDEYTYSSGSYASPSGYSNNRSNSVEASQSAYLDINHTLDNFYDEPQEDAEKEELRAELEQLKRSMAEQQKVSSSYENQVQLLEKSYELASKYLPGVQPANNPGNHISSVKEVAVVPIFHIKSTLVSSLNQPMTDLEFVKQQSQERNLDFNTVATKMATNEKNTIAAVIHGDQTLVDGQSVRIRISEAMQVGQSIIPRNTILTGIGRISGERLEIFISSIEFEGKIIPVEMQVFDSDGQAGIYIPGSMEMTAIKEIAGNMGQNLGSTINISQQSAGEQLLTDLGREIIQGTSQYASRKVQEIKVTLKAGYRILLLPADNN